MQVTAPAGPEGRADDAGRVLLVALRTGLREAAASRLHRDGIPCDAIGDPQEATRVLDARRHEVLVVDMGTAASRRLAASEGARVAVVAVARRASVDGAVAALRARAVDYLVEPVRPAALVHVVQLARDRARAARGVRRAERLVTLWAEWLRLLDAVLAAPGPAALPVRLLAAVARDRASVDDETAGWRTRTTLSPREQEVLLAFAAGLRARQIARSLGVSVHTARAHLKAIMRKLEVHSQSALLERVHALEEPRVRKENVDAPR